ncbi:MAG: PA14 domain-containing protein, partial [Nitrospira sp.]|nr:PA14 domain-containing protein [Nitrospira sp.]
MRRYQWFALLLIVTGMLQHRLHAQNGGALLVPGLLRMEVYTNITGTAVQGLLDDPQYPNQVGQVLYPAGFNTRTVLPTDSLENFGARITGFVIPPESGDYEFFLRSDDASQLFLSTDETETNLQPIAEEVGCCNAFQEPGATQTSSPITLVAGRRYLIRALYKEGTGGDFCQVAWRKVGDTTPAAQLLPISPAFISVSLPAQGTVTISRQPVSLSAAQNDFATFSVEVTTTNTPVLVQWQRNGVTLPDRTGATLTLGPIPASDNGAKYRALISTPGAIATSDEATLTVTPDVTRPTIIGVSGSETFDSVTVDFSEALTAATAGTASNYSLDGGVTVSAATVLSPTSVRLTTSKQAQATTYTLTARNLVDTAGNTIADNATATFSSFAPILGGMKFQAYLNIAGSAIQGLLDDPRYPASPDIVGYATSFTSRGVFTDSSHENYGGRISGWLVPTETAQYEFFLRSDDASQLHLSTDETEANAQMIAEETGCCGPFEEPGAPETSAPVSLTAGQRYFILAIWKEGGGGDYCDVAWRKVGDATAPRTLGYIPGTVLQSIAAPGTFTPPTIAITQPTDGSSVRPGTPVTITVDVAASSGKRITKVEYFEATKKLGEATTAPWSLTLSDLTEDIHVLTARATDTAGITKDSTPVSLTIGEPAVQRVLVAINDQFEWSYDRSGTDLGTEWRSRTFNDSAWPKGKALIADESTTTVEPIRTAISRFNDNNEYVKTFYFRAKFNYTDFVAPGVKLKLRHVVDDGAVFYLNGTEIHRFGIAEGPVDATTDATGHENAYEGPYEIPIDLLVPGENVLAAEVHQSGGSSSDMVFGAELIATIPTVITNLVAINDTTLWRYDRSGTDLGTEWRSRTFNDNTWPQGKALIADESTTTVEPIRTAISRFNDNNEYVKTFYFRTRFNLGAVGDATVIAKLRHVV